MTCLGKNAAELFAVFTSNQLNSLCLYIWQNDIFNRLYMETSFNNKVPTIFRKRTRLSVIFTCYTWKSTLMLFLYMWLLFCFFLFLFCSFSSTLSLSKMVLAAFPLVISRWKRSNIHHVKYEQYTQLSEYVSWL